MSDLYKDAAAAPLRLHRRLTVVGYDELRSRGQTRAAIRWAEEHGRLHRPFRGTYLAGPQPPDLLDRLTALAQRLPRGAAIGFHTAAALYGFGVVPSPDFHVVVPRGMSLPQLRGVATHEAVLAFDPVDVLGLPCVPANRCAVDLARTVRRIDALPVLDAALFAQVCSEDELRSEVARHGRLRGVRQARELIALADARPACRQESQVRLLLHDARLPVPVPQLAVRDDDGYVRCVLDLGYERERLGLEYDGASHLSRERMRADRSRHNWLAAQGWSMRYLTDHDLYRAPTAFIADVRTALFGRRRRTSRPHPPPRSRTYGWGSEIKARP